MPGIAERVEDYCRQISFRGLRPETPLPAWSLPLFRRAEYMHLSVERAITRLPDAQMAARLAPLLPMRRMATVAIGSVLNTIVSQLPSDQCYVNVGCWHGFSLLAGMVGNPDKRCVGIDNFSEFGGPRESFLQRFERHRSAQHEFWEMDYHAYFADVHQGAIGFYLYDGEHSYENQLEGLLTAEPFLAPEAIIAVDDTNWDSAHQATLDFMARAAGGYRLLFDQRTAINGHPTYWNGLMVLARVA
ncbi:MAG: class I SAM-dependent methyltransferase [Armatimonadetes bacterium]|nr:class I SAM-dependent methyltransferase [Armatimonadota bacterium]